MNVEIFTQSKKTHFSLKSSAWQDSFFCEDYDDSVDIYLQKLKVHGLSCSQTIKKFTAAKLFLFTQEDGSAEGK